MTTISNINSAALMILQQTNLAATTNEGGAESSNLVAVANGVADKIGVSQQPGKSESKISEAMFSVNNVNINKLKIELIDRAADALGFDRDDYESDNQFSSAMRVSVIKLAAQDGGDEAIKKIEAELGLDKLGVTLLDVVSSANNPEADDNVTEALREREELKKKEDEESDPSAPLSIQLDEAGTYNASAV